MSNLKFLWLTFFCLVVGTLLAMRFPQVNSGSIEGFVHDERGAPIARVSVQAFNIMRGGTSRATAQSNGYFRIADLVGGRYNLWVEARGYNSERIPLVVVEDGRATRKDIQLNRDLEH
jgi:hypothetical protein